MKEASAAQSFGLTLMQLYEQIEDDTFILLLLFQMSPFKDNGGWEVRSRVGVSITQIKLAKVTFGRAVTFQKRFLNEKYNLIKSVLHANGN